MSVVTSYPSGAATSCSTYDPSLSFFTFVLSVPLIHVSSVPFSLVTRSASLPSSTLFTLNTTAFPLKSLPVRVSFAPLSSSLNTFCLLILTSVSVMSSTIVTVLPLLTASLSTSLPSLIVNVMSVVTS